MLLESDVVLPVVSEVVQARPRSVEPLPTRRAPDIEIPPVRRARSLEPEPRLSPVQAQRHCVPRLRSPKSWNRNPSNLSTTRSDAQDWVDDFISHRKMCSDQKISSNVQRPDAAPDSGDAERGRPEEVGLGGASPALGSPTQSVGASESPTHSARSERESEPERSPEEEPTREVIDYRGPSQELELNLRNVAERLRSHNLGSGRSEDRGYMSSYEMCVDRWDRLQPEAPSRQVSDADTSVAAVVSDYVQKEISDRLIVERHEAVELRTEMARLKAQSTEEIAKLRTEVEKLRSRRPSNTPERLRSDESRHREDSVCLSRRSKVFSSPAESSRTTFRGYHFPPPAESSSFDRVDPVPRAVDVSPSLDHSAVHEVARLQAELHLREKHSVAANEQIAQLQHEVEQLRALKASVCAKDQLSPLDGLW